MPPHLHSVPNSPTNPRKARKQNRDSERLRVMKAYADICKEEHQVDLDQITDFVRNWSQFPITAEEVVDAAIQGHPNNVLCRAADRMSISSRITNIFRTRADISLTNPNKGGGTYCARVPVSALGPKPVSTAQTITPVQTAQFATAADLARVEQKVDGLIAALQPLLQ